MKKITTLIILSLTLNAAKSQITPMECLNINFKVNGSSNINKIPNSGAPLISLNQKNSYSSYSHESSARMCFIYGIDLNIGVSAKEGEYAEYISFIRNENGLKMHKIKNDYNLNLNCDFSFDEKIESLNINCFSIS